MLNVEKNSRFQTIRILVLVLLSACASSNQAISEQDTEQKLARIVLGQTTQSEVESIFGVAKPKEPQFWVYSLTESATELVAVRSRLGTGMPIPLSTPTNTRALITVRFDRAGVVNALETARFFSMPFINEYRYRTKDMPDKTLESVARLAEGVGFKVSALEKSAGVMSLEDTGSKARMTVRATEQLLHIVSTNPHDRLSSEYRVYTKRETTFTEQLVNSEMFQ